MAVYERSDYFSSIRRSFIFWEAQRNLQIKELKPMSTCGSCKEEKIPISQPPLGFTSKWQAQRWRKPQGRGAYNESISIMSIWLCVIFLLLSFRSKGFWRSQLAASAMGAADIWPFLLLPCSTFSLFLYCFCFDVAFEANGSPDAATWSRMPCRCLVDRKALHPTHERGSAAQ